MHYVEVYNPKYWMQMKGIRPRSCFHPMYCIKTRNTVSPLNNMPIAIWSTVHADVIADATNAVPAASVHMGIPLWYFDHDEVRALADAIFREWHIKVDE